MVLASSAPERRRRRCIPEDSLFEVVRDRNLCLAFACMQPIVSPLSARLQNPVSFRQYSLFYLVDVHDKPSPSAGDQALALQSCQVFSDPGTSAEGPQSPVFSESQKEPAATSRLQAPPSRRRRKTIHFHLNSVNVTWSRSPEIALAAVVQKKIAALPRFCNPSPSPCRYSLAVEIQYFLREFLPGRCGLRRIARTSAPVVIRLEQALPCLQSERPYSAGRTGSDQNILTGEDPAQESTENSGAPPRLVRRSETVFGKKFAVRATISPTDFVFSILFRQLKKGIDFAL